jgi:electron transfer flavoprotein beta subunit
MGKKYGFGPQVISVTVADMHIAVAVRLMPKTGEELELDPSGRDIDREYVEQTITDFDDQALEEAVLIKEATGATVTAVGLRADGIDQALNVPWRRPRGGGRRR